MKNEKYQPATFVVEKIVNAVVYNITNHGLSCSNIGDLNVICMYKVTYKSANHFEYRVGSWIL